MAESDALETEQQEECKKTDVDSGDNFTSSDNTCCRGTLFQNKWTKCGVASLVVIVIACSVACVALPILYGPYGHLEDDYNSEYSSRSISSKPPATQDCHQTTVKRIHDYQIPVGSRFSVGSGYLLLENKHGYLLSLRRMKKGHQGGVSTETIWEMPNPVKAGAQKFILNNGGIVMRHSNEHTTYIFTQQMDLVLQSTGDYGDLVAVLPSNDLVYREAGTDGYNLHIYSSVRHTYIRRLEGVWTFSLLSVCGNASGWMAVTSAGDNNLRIFSPDGRLYSEQTPYYMPWFVNGLAAVGDMLVIISRFPVGLSLHSWSGKQMTMVTREGLGLGTELFGGVGLASMDNSFYVVTGRTKHNVSLGIYITGS